MDSLTQNTSLDDREEQFLEQSDLFIEKLLSNYKVKELSSLEVITSRNPLPIQPIILEDYQNITSEQRLKLKEDYYSEQGIAYYVALNSFTPPRYGHPLFDIANQLAEDLGLHYPLKHPLEGHPQAVARFGPPDGTVKIYNLIKKDGVIGYREQGETADMFSLHNDGLGSGGTVATTALYMESAPLSGGYTFFQNILRLSLELAREDIEAFRHLFLPDVVTQMRPRGKGAIKVNSPVLFLNENNDPQASFRTSTGEYIVEWRKDLPALNRAMEFLNYYARPLSPGSFFLHFTAPGHGCFIRNQVVAHGRTAFIDGSEPHQKRVLARKWFMISERDAIYKHIPSMFLLRKYADLFPELFGSELLEGEWLYDPRIDKNVRIK